MGHNRILAASSSGGRLVFWWWPGWSSGVGLVFWRRLGLLAAPRSFRGGLVFWTWPGFLAATLPFRVLLVRRLLFQKTTDPESWAVRQVSVCSSTPLFERPLAYQIPKRYRAFQCPLGRVARPSQYAKIVQ